MSLDLDRRHALALVATGALRGEVDEAAQVTPLVLLVLAASRISLRTFAMRRSPFGSARIGQVVVEGRDRSVEQGVERVKRSLGAKLFERGAELAPVAGRRAPAFPRAIASSARVGQTWPGLSSGSRAAWRRSQSESGLAPYAGDASAPNR